MKRLLLLAAESTSGSQRDGRRINGRRWGRVDLRILSAVLAAGMGLTTRAARGQTADTSSPPSAATIAQMQAQIQALQNRVNVLESSPTQQAADRAAETQKVLDDADQNSQILPANALSSGYDPDIGFVLRSPDGQFTFHPGALIDVRNMTSVRSDVPSKGGGSDEPSKTGYDTQNGFDLTRARLTFDGHYTKNLSYFLQFQDDQGTSFNLLDAYATLRFSDTSPFYIKFGQFKDPVWHERNLSEATLLAVDRSLVEALLGGGQTSRVQGAALIYNQDQFRTQLVLHDGYDSLNTKFFDAGGMGPGVGGGAGVTPTNFGVSNRTEYMVIGGSSPTLNNLPGVFPRSHPYSEYDGGFTALGDTQDILVVGGGFDYSQAGDNDVFFHTVDAQYDTAGGLSLYGAYLGTYRDLRSSQGVVSTAPTVLVPPGNYYDPGVVAQASYLVTPQIEPFARYDYTYLSGGSTSAFSLATNKAQEITVGANYYLYKQHVKFTLDGSFLPDGSPTDQDALGILTDSGHPEYVVRFQFQLSI